MCQAVFSTLFQPIEAPVSGITAVLLFLVKNKTTYWSKNVCEMNDQKLSFDILFVLMSVPILYLIHCQQYIGSAFVWDCRPRTSNSCHMVHHQNELQAHKTTLWPSHHFRYVWQHLSADCTGSLSWYSIFTSKLWWSNALKWTLKIAVGKQVFSDVVKCHDCVSI